MDAFIDGTPVSSGVHGAYTNDYVSLLSYTNFFQGGSIHNYFDNLSVTAAAPEPGSLALLVGMGAASAGCLGRRRGSARRMV